MSVSSIPPVAAAATPAVTTHKPAPSAASPAPVAQVSTDADGDHDGSVGSKVNVKA